MMTFVATAAFCLLSLLGPDSALMSGSDGVVNLPLAGPVSFLGFIVLGPTVLVALRIYLQIYLEHGVRLEKIAGRRPVARAPVLVPLQNPLLRLFSAAVFYLLLPAAMLLFTWKAAVLPSFLPGLVFVSAAVITGHVVLLMNLSWRWRIVVSLTVALIALVATIPVYPSLRRSFQLEGANLSNRPLSGTDLEGAWLGNANLRGAILLNANLRKAFLGEANLNDAVVRGSHLVQADLGAAKIGGADLRGSDLTGVNLSFATLSNSKLSAANLTEANLSLAVLDEADLRRAVLSKAILLDAKLTKVRLLSARFRDAELRGANLTDADLTGALDLKQEQLDRACGRPARLPMGLVLDRPCSN
jgi:uncharacterized protein YjbI with pentapeptide repeats